jgi:hypothetical protein
MNVRSVFIFIVCMVAGCGIESESTEPLIGQEEDFLIGSVGCTASAARYPTVPADMGAVYQNRRFYADGNHLGHDMSLVEGTPIHPIACGTLRVYRSASGYGELVAVIEHRLSEPLLVSNGMGERVTVSSFLSIYGHIRKSADRTGTDGLLGHIPGDTVGPDDVIGYVNDDAHNGDGGEHLHLGIRLQSVQDAQAADVNWFRGYDGNPSQRRWYADPVLFLATLTSNVMPVFWHPPGSILRRPTDGTVWVVDHDLNRWRVDLSLVSSERLTERAIDVSDAELGCLNPSYWFTSPRADRSVLKFDDASTVYEYVLGDGAERRAFISYDAFRSWGWRDEDIAIWPASQRATFFASTMDHGLRTLRDGSLVKTEAGSEVSVVSEGRRLPIFDWPTFLALGYRSEDIITLPEDTIDLVAGPRGPLITPDLIGYCVHPSACVDNCPPLSGGGGTGEDPPDDPPEDPPSDIPVGKVRFRYQGEALPGLHQFQGMWDPPGAAFYDWTPDTFVLCPDNTADDGRLECLIDAPGGTTDFLFTVRLPDGRWWGDLTCTSTGGCGMTIGTVTLEGPNGPIAYELLSNGSGPDYRNGFVAMIP